MGGFLFWKTTDSAAEKSAPLRVDRARRVMAEAGVKTGKLLERPGFALQLYEKARWSVANVLEFPNGDFIATTGTLFYRRKIGQEALEQLYGDFTAGKPVLRNLLGQFAVLIWHRQRLTLFNDFNASYHLFSLFGGRFVSSSFLAAAAASPTLTPSTDEIYEYLIFGAFHGTETLYREVSCLSRENTYELAPEFSAKPRELRVDVPWAGTSISRDDLVDVICSNLKDYFSVLVENFGDEICSAVSGGLDSRLMLAILRNLKVVPKLYVYGSDTTKDVKVARRVCEGEKLLLDVIDKSKFRPPLSPVEYVGAFRQEIFSVDGRSPLGAASDGVEMLMRQRRLEKARLHINGVGGESYRDFWQLPNVSFSPRAMVARTYERSYIPYYFLCTGKFPKEAFFEKTARKIGALAGVNGNNLQRTDVEAVYTYYRKFCMNLSYYPNNLLAFSLAPFFEALLAQPSHHIPLQFKRHGGFEMALIRRMDPEVAKYPSQYGYTFSQDVNRKQKFRNWLVILNRHFIKGRMPLPLLTKLYRRKIQKEKFPYHLDPAFTKELVGGGLEASKEYIDPGLVWDTSQMSRVITLEYLLRKFPGTL